MRKLPLYRERYWKKSLARLQNSPKRVLLLPGIMGSELIDHEAGGATRWVGRRPHFLRHEALDDQGSRDMHGNVLASRHLDLFLKMGQPYRQITRDRELRPCSWAFDWRESIPLTARLLRMFLGQAIKEEVIDDKDHKLHIVAHSMGALVVLYMLEEEPWLSDYIAHIVLAAAPIHGALAPLRPIEQGLFGFAIDWVVFNNSLQHTAATMPGLFQLLPVSKDLWPATYDIQGAATPMTYPVDGATNFFEEGVLLNPYALEMRQDILRFAHRFHENFHERLPDVVATYADRLNVIVGVNSKTPTVARFNGSRWSLKDYQGATGDPNMDKTLPGDGTVSTVSSLLPGLPATQYYGSYNNNRSHSQHSNILESSQVLQAVKDVFSGDAVTSLHALSYFDMDFGPLEAQAAVVNLKDGWMERAYQRTYISSEQWDVQGLNETYTDPNTPKDAARYVATSAAARAVLDGARLEDAAQHIGESEEWLEEHIRRRLFL